MKRFAAGVLSALLLQGLWVPWVYPQANGAPAFMLSTVRTVVDRIQPWPLPIVTSALEDKAQTYGAIFSALTVAREAIASRRR